MTRRLYFFTDPLAPSEGAQAELLGGKGAWLRRLTAEGYDVPPGFTITTNAVETLENADNDARDALRNEVAEAVRRLAEITGRPWACGPAPLTVAVRSGASESLPGLMRTILFCGWSVRLATECPTSQGWRQYAEFLAGMLPASLQSEGRRCLSNFGGEQSRSWNEDRWPRAAHQLLSLLRTESGPLDDDPDAWLWLAIVSVAASAGGRGEGASPGPGLAGGSIRTAVTVQAMFEAEVSGVLQSRNPLNPSADECLIETAAGHGLEMMSGRLTPRFDLLPRSASDLAVNERPGGGKPDHSSAMISTDRRQRLLKLSQELEQLAGGPVEVEWAAAGDRLVLLQCRQCRTGVDLDVLVQCEEDALRSAAAAGRPLWVRHQLSESLPAPTPLTWSVWSRFVSPGGGLGRLYRRLGYAPRRFADGDGAFRLIGGRIYCDPDRWVQMICGSFPWRYDEQQLTSRPELLQEAPTRFDPQRLDPWFLLTWPHLVWVLWRASRKRAHLERVAANEFSSKTAPHFERELSSLASPLAAATRLGEQTAVVEQLRAWLFDEQAPRLLLPGWLGVHAWHAAVRQLQQAFPAQEAAQVQSELLKVVERAGTLCDAVTDHEDDALSPEWWSDEHLELLTVSEPTADPVSSASWRGTTPGNRGRQSSDVDRRSRVAKELRSIVHGGLRRRLEPPLQRAAELLPLRTAGKALFLRGYRLFRDRLASVAADSGLGRQLYFLCWDELLLLHVDRVEPGELDRREGEWLAWRRRPVPLVVRGDAARPLAAPPPASGADCLAVRGLSPGQAAGRAWRPRPDEASPPAGVIAVLESIDSRTLLRWEQVAGVVVEQGGLLSHAAVTARLRGMPTAVLADATRMLTDGRQLWLDATRGELLVSEAPPHAATSTGASG